MAKPIMVAPKPVNLAAQAGDALRASVRLSNDIVGVMDLLNGRGGLQLTLTDLNRTATIKQMRKRVADLLRFVETLENT